MNDRCGAKTKSGSPCQKFPVKGAKRCRLHGGLTPRGPASPHWRTGIYSKYASESLREVIQDLEKMDTEDLIQPGGELRLMQALIIHAKALEKDITDLEDLDTISKVISRLTSDKMKAQKIMMEQKKLIPATDVERFLNFTESLLMDYIDSETAFKIINKMKTFKLSDYEA